MKPRILFALLILFFGITIFIFLSRGQPTEQVFNATIQLDCAPWDGSAFTVQIPLNRGDLIHISIWKAPTITFPTTYTFPDATGQIGNAILIYPTGDPELLTGTVTFTRVEETYPVEGQFKFIAANGTQLVGHFKAEWNNQVMLCG
jgi:hypothetical protein